MNRWSLKRRIDELRRTQIRNNRLLTKLMQVDETIRAFEEAHKELYGYENGLNYHGNWYTVHLPQAKKLRAREVHDLTRQMQAAKHEQTLNEGIPENDL